MRIELDAVSKDFGKVRALDQISLDLKPGSIYAMLGSNGAGKTTLLQMIHGLVTPSEGVIRYDGRPFSRADLEVRRELFYLPDFPAFFADATVLSHIATVLHLYDADLEGIEKETASLLDQFEILPFANASLLLLSRGQAYKAALAALILAKPGVWLIDEPMASGMDPNGLRLFKSFARKAADAGAIVLYTTQIAEVVQQLSDYVIVLDAAKLVTVESTSAILQKTGSATLEEALQRLQSAPTSA